MDFRDKVFIAVAESLSFSKAAEKLYVSQPAISRHIKEMETTVGIQLFERKGNRIYLTLAGEITYNHLKKVVQLYGELDFALGALKDEHKGVLRIGASSGESPKNRAIKKQTKGRINIWLTRPITIAFG